MTMKVRVIFGRVKYNGASYETGAEFLVQPRDEKEFAALIGKVVEIVHDEPKTQPKSEPPAGGDDGMAVKELKVFLESAEANVETVEKLLADEQAKPDPRASAVKLLEDWLKNNTKTDGSDDDAAPPALNPDDVIVRGGGDA